MVTISVKIPADIASKIETEARLKRVFKSALIRSSLEKRYALSNSRRRPTVGNLVGHLAGKLKGAPSDLSTNKKYMEGFGAS